MKLPEKTVIDNLIDTMKNKGWPFPRQIINRLGQVVGCTWGADADPNIFGVGLFDNGIIKIGRAKTLVHESSHLNDVELYLTEHFATPTPGAWQPKWRVG